MFKAFALFFVALAIIQTVVACINGHVSRGWFHGSRIYRSEQPLRFWALVYGYVAVFSATAAVIAMQ